MRNQKEIPIPKTEAGKTKIDNRYLYLNRKQSEQLFPNMGLLSYPNCENVHKVQTAQKVDSKT